MTSKRMKIWISQLKMRIRFLWQNTERMSKMNKKRVVKKTRKLRLMR